MSVVDGVEETTEREVHDADTLHHSLIVASTS